MWYIYIRDYGRPLGSRGLCSAPVVIDTVDTHVDLFGLVQNCHPYFFVKCIFWRIYPICGPTSQKPWRKPKSLRSKLTKIEKISEKWFCSFFFFCKIDDHFVLICKKLVIMWRVDSNFGYFCDYPLDIYVKDSFF